MEALATGFMRVMGRRLSIVSCCMCGVSGYIVISFFFLSLLKRKSSTIIVLLRGIDCGFVWLRKLFY